MKTGTHPMRTQLRLFLDWGITFDTKYAVPEKAQRKVAYANKAELERNILNRDNVYDIEDDAPPAERPARGQQQAPTTEMSPRRQLNRRSPYNTHGQEGAR
jgi:type IV secretion system protein VirD4